MTPTTIALNEQLHAQALKELEEQLRRESEVKFTLSDLIDVSVILADVRPREPIAKNRVAERTNKVWTAIVDYAEVRDEAESIGFAMEDWQTLSDFYREER
jgi:hypothetical protein